MRAGALDRRLEFQRRALDTRGERTGEWEAGFKVAASVTYLRGGEEVMAQRLQGQQPAVIVVRASSRTRPINNSYRAVDIRNGETFDITAATLSKDRAAVEILATGNGPDA